MSKAVFVIGLIILIAVLIFFFWLIVSGVLGGIIGFFLCWLNQKRRFIKIADKWIFIVAIALIIILVVIGNLLFPTANYIAAGLIGFTVGYWLSLE